MAKQNYGEAYTQFQRYIFKRITYRDILRRINRYRRLFMTSNTKRHTKKYHDRWVYWIAIAIAVRESVDHDYYGFAGVSPLDEES